MLLVYPNSAETKEEENVFAGISPNNSVRAGACEHMTATTAFGGSLAIRSSAYNCESRPQQKHNQSTMNQI